MILSHYSQFFQNLFSIFLISKNHHPYFLSFKNIVDVLVGKSLSILHYDTFG